MTTPEFLPHQQKGGPGGKIQVSGLFLGENMFIDNKDYDTFTS